MNQNRFTSPVVWAAVAAVWYAVFSPANCSMALPSWLKTLMTFCPSTISSI